MGTTNLHLHMEQFSFEKSLKSRWTVSPQQKTKEMHWQGLKWQRHSLTLNPFSDIVLPQSGKWKRKWCVLSHARLFTTPWTKQSMEFSRPEYWSGYPFPSPEDLPNPGIKLRPPAMPADSLPAEPQGTPKNTGVGSLSLLQRIFPTEESNWDLLHCRQILYQLSHEGSPQSGSIPQYKTLLRREGLVPHIRHPNPRC